MARKMGTSFPTLGQRLLAAIVSYQLGHVGVDRVLRDYSDGPVESWWEEKGMELARRLVTATHQSITETSRREGVGESASSQYDTKAEILKLLELFLQEAAGGAFTHFSQHYTGSTTGAPGLVIYMASCPDKVAEELHFELNQSGQRCLEEHGITPVKRQ